MRLRIKQSSRGTFSIKTHHNRSTPLSHLSDAALEQLADVGGLGQDARVPHPSQVHGGVDVQALGLARGRLLLHGALVHPQVALPHVPLGHHAVPLAQGDRLRAAEDGLAWRDGEHTAGIPVNVSMGL